MKANKSNKRHPGGRPTKLTDRFIEAARKVIENDMALNTIILTDEELVIAINEELPQKERITDRTLERWKASKNPKRLSEQGKSFVALIKKALVRQKQYLFKRLSTDEKSWQRFAWIIERKFEDWNIKQKVDYTSKGKQIVGFNFLPPAKPDGKNNSDDKTGT